MCFLMLVRDSQRGVPNKVVDECINVFLTLRCFPNLQQVCKYHRFPVTTSRWR